MDHTASQFAPGQVRPRPVVHNPNKRAQATIPAPKPAHSATTSRRPAAQISVQPTEAKPVIDGIFVVMSSHHRPWGGGNNHVPVGVFHTEKEAKDAGYAKYDLCAQEADGWEHECIRMPGDGTLFLHAKREEGERDTGTFKVEVQLLPQDQQRTAIGWQPFSRHLPRSLLLSMLSEKNREETWELTSPMDSITSSAIFER